MLIRLLKALLVVAIAIGAFRFGWRASPDAAETGSSEAGDLIVTTGAGRGVEVSAAQRRRTLQLIADSDTYVPHFLVEHDSTLRRWKARVERPLLIYFSSEGSYTEKYGQAVYDAFRRWQRVSGIPVTFELVSNQADSDVVVRWIGSFGTRRSGQADVSWRSDGWVQSATLTLATQDDRGRFYSTDAMYTVCLHEIGHLLGLGHSDDPGDVMAPETGVHDLTNRDRRTAMFLYSLTPGSLKGY